MSRQRENWTAAAWFTSEQGKHENHDRSERASLISGRLTGMMRVSIKWCAKIVLLMRWNKKIQRNAKPTSSQTLILLVENFGE